MDVAVIKYNAGNIRSVLFALERLQVNTIVTDEEDKIRSADKVIFPGVGEASSAMAYLKDKKLDKVILSLTQPVLGICLGMQLMCSFSEENDTPCLGIFKETVKHFPKNSYKVPQIGWNNIYDLSNTLFSGIAENSYVYFIHGFYVGVSKYTIAKTNYILEYSAALHKNNFYAVQFHPEKSGKIGQKILENFLFQV
ncbi:MAG TPA: imidazole glycerol phosphate synthase subunit HisH [Paludibacteraceae bacterium]|nr:imidazole glycerol phosphate synthase subunit HisH [Paludibacteraceae bacterium]HOL00927.1 imidazole glycerol phosphate synthase subunit HisH [Paludibacteraceae bacterium]HPO67701.1 imidazole glycerol phosphate synthase subunit HisH [Paludibacteraceae bacterium]HRR62365.1 imidazole glycerol phosphate synthase subunit HisH [Paludibacteraceae bacterium]